MKITEQTIEAMEARTAELQTLFFQVEQQLQEVPKQKANAQWLALVALASLLSCISGLAIGFWIWGLH